MTDRPARIVALLSQLEDLAARWEAEAEDHKRRSPTLMQLQWDAYTQRAKELRAIIETERIS